MTHHERQAAIGEERIEVEGGKYTIVAGNDGSLRALRYGEAWQDLTGNKMVYCLATELRDARAEIQALRESAPAALALDPDSASSVQEYLAKFADLNDEPEGGDCRKLLASIERQLAPMSSSAAEPSRAVPTQGLLEQMRSVLDRLANGEDFNAVVEQTGITAKVTEALADQGKPCYVVIQEGGSSDELYVNAYDDQASADAFRVDCTSDGSYRTSPVIQAPRSLVDHPEFLDVAKSLARSVLELDYVDVDEEADDAAGTAAEVPR